MNDRLWTWLLITAYSAGSWERARTGYNAGLRGEDLRRYAHKGELPLQGAEDGEA